MKSIHANRPTSLIKAFYFVSTFIVFSSTLLSLKAEEVVMSRQDFEDMLVEISNWGRWGKDDQKGTLNFITPEVRMKAAQLVTDGVAISLSRNADKEKSADNGRPYTHTIRAAKATDGGSSDSISISPHGIAHTHIDALCHQLHQGKMYNGFSYKEITEKGAHKNSILNQKEGIFTRAVLFDIPTLKGVRYLKGDTAIYPDDLEEWERRMGLRVQKGDIVLIRTGHWLDREENGPKRGPHPGIHASCMKWLHHREAAMVGSDLALDVEPSGIEGIRGPAHDLSIIAMGMPILDAADFGPLSIECKKRQRWAFLLTMAPLAIPGATGSPVNPTAIF
jgi:kynurenine formamidase